MNGSVYHLKFLLKTNKLYLNEKKTKYMIFHTAQIKVNTLHLTINNTIIDRVTQFDFLGITMNENLTKSLTKFHEALVF